MLLDAIFDAHSEYRIFLNENQVLIGEISKYKHILPYSFKPL